MNILSATHAYLESISDRSRHTKTAYATDLTQFVSYVSPTKACRALSSSLIERWAKHLTSSGLTIASKKRKLATVRCLLNFCHRRKWISTSPFILIRFRFPSVPAPPRNLNRGEAQQILLAANAERGRSRNQLATFRAQRNLAVVHVLLATGIRVGELVDLRISDLNLTEGTIVVNGKGGRIRPAFITDPVTLTTLGDYLVLRHCIQGTSPRFLVNARGNSLTSQGVAYILQRLARSAGIDRHVTPHMLRHTAATLLLESGVDLRLIQEFLGHASVLTTQRYTHVTRLHLRSVLRMHSPITGLLRQSQGSNTTDN